MFDNFTESEEDTIEEETDSKFEVLSSIEVSEHMKIFESFKKIRQIGSSELVKVETNIDSAICFENHPDHMFGLNCGHVYCHSCWTSYISIKITDQDDSIITCPELMSCPTRINDESIFDFIDNQDIKTKYQQLIIKSFIQLNPMLKWCPGPDCNYTIHQIQNNVDQAAIQVECICGYEFCFQCSQPFHDPAIVSCDLMENWISNLPTTNEDDSKTRDYFQKNVKNCPKCDIPIEKSYGCDYVRCTNVACKTLFCFKFSRSGENNGQKESAGTSIASQPYLLMINKYLHQERSMNLEKKILKDVNLENYMEEEILQTLSKSRQTLMNTYVFSNFYISPIFENQVSNLEIVTEKLSHLVQSDLEQNFTQIKITSEECKKIEK